MLPIQYSIAIRGTKPGTKKADIKETKAYPVIQLYKTLTLNELASHMEEHNSKFTRGDITAVLLNACDCIIEHLKQGFGVNMGEIGTFYPTLKVTGAKTAEECSADNIEKVNITFSKGVGLKAMETRAGLSFVSVPSRQAQADALASERGATTQQPAEGGGDGDNSMD